MMPFYRCGYLMHHAISQLAVPQVAFMDGICFGGGAGICTLGSFKVATERWVSEWRSRGLS